MTRLSGEDRIPCSSWSQSELPDARSQFDIPIRSVPPMAACFCRQPFPLDGVGSSMPNGWVFLSEAASVQSSVDCSCFPPCFVLCFCFSSWESRSSKNDDWMKTKSSRELLNVFLFLKTDPLACMLGFLSSEFPSLYVYDLCWSISCVHGSGASMNMPLDLDWEIGRFILDEAFTSLLLCVRVCQNCPISFSLGTSEFEQLFLFSALTGRWIWIGVDYLCQFSLTSCTCTHTIRIIL